MHAFFDFPRSTAYFFDIYFSFSGENSQNPRDENFELFVAFAFVVVAFFAFANFARHRAIFGARAVLDCYQAAQNCLD